MDAVHKQSKLPNYTAVPVATFMTLTLTSLHMHYEVTLNHEITVTYSILHYDFIIEIALNLISLYKNYVYQFASEYIRKRSTSLISIFLDLESWCRLVIQ